MRTEKIEINIVKWEPGKRSPRVAAFLERPAFDARAELLARKVLAEIKRQGDRALLKYIRRFDGVDLGPGQLKVSKSELKAARRAVDAGFMKAARVARGRILRFARQGMRKNWGVSYRGSGFVGERFVPLERVGVYVPGGKAPLVSTALMTVTLAKAAGVSEIVACSPAGRDAGLNPFLLCALELAGATEIYKIGGIQAIGAMALGTKTIKKVLKIVGPGGPFVTAAKRCVYGNVALDLVAGPSEIAILADQSSQAGNVAADLLSQAEHGTGREKALLVTTSSSLATAVRAELLRQARFLPRWPLIRQVLKQGTLIVVVNNLADGLELCNRFAPEHLELMVNNPERWLGKVRNAGAVFIGNWSPECVGDFVAGPSHVLPTGGTASMFSGLTVDDFRKRISVINFKRADLKNVLGVISTFARVEGLAAHARSAEIRFK